ncbi:MAG: FadR family transcriptional regulator [Treponema sp.]|jgi:DNA-binding FadR family transcriptional regulator|nr:FadR family transcriptional regulator [Treponema sp.]
MFDNQLIPNTVNGDVSLLTEQIADQICRLIHERQLLGGVKIPNEFELAQLFHVGRGTVREAVKLLTSKKILEIRRGKGTYVCEKPGMVDDPFGFHYTENKIQLIADLMTIRYLLEPEIAGLAACYATGGEIEQMKKAVRSIEELAGKNADYSNEDIAFHTLIAKSSRNMVMPNLIPVINYGIDLYNHSLKKYQTMKALMVHRDIIAAIEKHDPGAAKLAMRNHLEYNRQNVQTLLDRGKKKTPSSGER